MSLSRDDGNRRFPPSDRKLKEAIARADVSRSDLGPAALGFLAAVLVLVFGIGWAVAMVVRAFRLAISGAFSALPFVDRLAFSWREGLETSTKFLVPSLGCFLAVAVLFRLVELRGRLRITRAAERMRPRGRGAVTGSFVVVALSAVAAYSVYDLRGSIGAVGGARMRLGAAALLGNVGRLTTALLSNLIATLLALLLADLLWQRWRWLQSLRMTRQEVEVENRAVHGDPALRTERARIGRE